MIYLNKNDSIFLLSASNAVKTSWLAPLLDICADTGSDITIAGGAIRDIIFGKPVSDIDIFYSDAIPEFLFTKLLLEEVEVSYGNTKWEVTHEGDFVGFKVQFIKVDGPSHEIVDTFPCNISKVFVKNNDLWCTSDFLSSFSKTVKWKGQVSYKYYDKIVSKYSNYNHSFIENSPPPFSDSTLASFIEDLKPVKKKYRILNSTTECYREFC